MRARFLIIIGFIIFGIYQLKAQTVDLNNPDENDLKMILIQPLVNNNDSLIQITGVLKNAETNEGIGSSEVIIMQNGNSLKTDTSDKEGNFIISCPKRKLNGNFDLYINNIAYNILFIKNIPVTNSKYYMKLQLKTTYILNGDLIIKRQDLPFASPDNNNEPVYNIDSSRHIPK